MRDRDHKQNSRVALVACGALARELLALIARHVWNAELCCVAALNHARPERIAPAVEQRLRELIPQFARVIVVYGDCGTRGALDAVLARYNVPRLAGPHCYEMFADGGFVQLMDDEPGTFFLTDFLVRGFRGTVVRGLGLDRFPELRPLYFGNYRRVVYLAQTDDAALRARAQAIADELELELVVRPTGYGGLEARLVALMAAIHEARYQPHLPEANQVRGDDDDLSDLNLARHPRAGARQGRRRARQRAAQQPLSRGDRPGGDGDGADRR
jgi:hypothetical protein